MSDKMIRKLSEDELQEVSGGNILLNNTIYDKKEKAGIDKTLLDENSKGDIELLGTSSGGTSPANKLFIRA